MIHFVIFTHEIKINDNNYRLSSVSNLLDMYSIFGK